MKESNSQNTLNERVRWMVDTYFEGKITHFAQEVGFAKASVSQWLRENDPLPVGYSSMLRMIKFFQGRLRPEWIRYGVGEPLEPVKPPSVPQVPQAELTNQQQFVEAKTADEQLAIESLEREIERKAIELERLREARNRLRSKHNPSGNFYSVLSLP